MTDIHTRRGHLDADRHREKTCEDKETRWSSTSQGKRPGTDPSFTALGRNQPCKHPDLRSSASRLLLTQPAVLRYGSPRYSHIVNKHQEAKVKIQQYWYLL